VRPAPGVLLAGQACQAVTGRTEWDQPAEFTTWTWDGTRLYLRGLTLIDPEVNPDSYPGLIASIASRDYSDHIGDPPYAYQLTAEGYGVAPPEPDASSGRKLLQKLDSATRAYHKRIDAVELATTLLADVHGRLFTATAYRNQPGRVEEIRFAPGRHPGGKIGTALVSAATVTGHLAYGYPPGPALRMEGRRG
jgi:hypothetical protein